MLCRVCVIIPAFLLAMLIGRPTFAAFPSIDDFENDRDVEETGVDYVPNDDPLNDPNLDGVPPGEPGVNEYFDIRSGGSAVIEEVESDHHGVTSSTGDHHAVVYPENGNGPFRGGGQNDTLAVGTWSHQMDLYIDSEIATGFGISPGNGVPDFWWTNSVGPGYITESGFTGEVLQTSAETPKFWRLTTTAGGNPSFNAALDTWYTLEVLFHDNGIDNHLAGTHKIWNQSHTELLYSFTLDHLFQDPLTSTAGRPGYQWFTYFEANMTHLHIDRAGVGVPITLPPSFILGDMDGDGDRDNFDIDDFELALTNSAAYLALHPTLTDYQQRGDIEGDNDFDNFDIQPFEELLTGGPGGAPVPEPSSLVLLGFGGLAALLLANQRRGRRATQTA